MKSELEQLLRSNAMLWRGGEGARPAVYPSGHPALDAVLPAGGWPRAALVEMVVPRWGVGELQLWLPLLARLSQAQQYVVWLVPPYVPYAPALIRAGVALEQVRVIPRLESEQAVLWSAERLLRAPACGVVLLWLSRLSAREARRLQLAAAAGQGVGVVFLPRDGGASPAALRLQLVPKRDGMQLRIVKARGGVAGRCVDLPWAHLQRASEGEL